MVCRGKAILSRRVAFFHPDIALKPRRWDSFKQGFRRCGFDVVDHANELKSGDVYCSWNRHSSKNAFLASIEQRGIRLVVVENGYCGDDRLRAIALHHHNGAGQWFVGDGERWHQQGITVKPWREDGEHVLVLVQRGIGEPGVASPMDWEHRAVAMLGKMTKRPIRVRRHPGRTKHPRPLADDLEDAWCVVTWASGGGVKAICAGIPVFHSFSRWIGRAAALPFNASSSIEQPYLGDRTEMLRAVSWAQWSLDEIERGDPWKVLL